MNGQRGLLPDGPSRRLSTLNAPSPGGLNGSGSTLLGKTSKIDPYYLITRVSLHSIAPRILTIWLNICSIELA